MSNAIVHQPEMRDEVKKALVVFRSVLPSNNDIDITPALIDLWTALLNQAKVPARLIGRAAARLALRSDWFPTPAALVRAVEEELVAESRSQTSNALAKQPVSSVDFDSMVRMVMFREMVMFLERMKAAGKTWPPYMDGGKPHKFWRSWETKVRPKAELRVASFGHKRIGADKSLFDEELSIEDVFGEE